jgi:hypothetical protein
VGEGEGCKSHFSNYRNRRELARSRRELARSRRDSEPHASNVRSHRQVHRLRRLREKSRRRNPASPEEHIDEPASDPCYPPVADCGHELTRQFLGENSEQHL